jgi:hypothetical protein
MLRKKRCRREEIIQKGKRTRLKNKLAARYKRMGGQGEPPSLRWGSLFDSVVEKADEGEGMIVVKSGADCDAAGPPRKKKLLFAQAAPLPWQ